MTWEEMKPLTPFGGIPVVEVASEDGEVNIVAQNQAIAHTLGRRLDLLGATDSEHARCSAVLSFVVIE